MQSSTKVKKRHFYTRCAEVNSIELIAKVSGESREQVRKYIRLTYLIPELLKIVDDTVIHDKKTYLTLGITTAVELSYLNKLDFNSLEKILDEKKGDQNDKITFDREKIEAVLPKELLKRDKRYIEKYIIEAIENYQNKIH